MSKKILSQKFKQSLIHQKLGNLLSNSKDKLHLKGALGSSLTFSISTFFKSSDRPFLLIFDTKEEAAYYLNDFEMLLDEKEVLFYPGSYRRPYQVEETDNANVLLRAEVLSRINSQKKPALIVTYPEALFEKVVSRKQLEKSTFKVTVGETLNLDFFNEVLFEYQFSRVDFVTDPGQFSVRGGIVDVFSFSHDEPYRIEFFGDEVDSIRTFDVESQLSIKTLKKIQILPNIEHKLIHESRQSFLEYISTNTVVFVKNISAFLAKTDFLHQRAAEVYSELSLEINHTRPENLFCSSASIKTQFLDFSVVEFGLNSLLATDISKKVQLQVDPQPSFNKQFNLLIEDLNTKHDLGYQNYICCSNSQQAQRFYDIFETVEQEVNCQIIVLSLYQGFVDHDNKLVCYTDHQIFERYHKFHLKNGYTKKQSITLKELTKLEIGDYITHIDHGIGKFGGLQKIDVEGKKQEAIKLFYGERDVLYLSIHALHKITKFNGKDGKSPKIYKLGSKAWKVLKQKTKLRVKEVAFNLIKLYAKRKLETGYRYKPDSSMQLELEASFMYEDTPDQITATADIKADMESERPMDRLICGDVGFGKTEVALRAAFKAVDNGKQVAILVPTTILAFQHAKTFKARFKEFPVTIDYVNRFKSTKQRKEVLEQLESGQLDIIIGTHQLVNKSVKFKDLGLLIVDEEQKFGVGHKERLKQLRSDIHVLTLTATPIPRTLQLSLSGVRELSVIGTPPIDRLAIRTYVSEFDTVTLREALLREHYRGGQSFFVVPRISDLPEIEAFIEEQVPEINHVVAHGQMPAGELDERMNAFYDGKFGILVATTIVESGLDIPTANTIIIHRADMFGLSQLYQIRGRVGRSKTRAYAYLTTKPRQKLTHAAIKRLRVLGSLDSLGAGFMLASQDLDIRGAGNILGEEQSGNVREVGYELYQEMLEDAIAKIKSGQMEGLTDEGSWSPQINLGVPVLIPETYVQDLDVRLGLYRRLSALAKKIELEAFAAELIDRFGKLPAEVDMLLRVVRIKGMCRAAGIAKLDSGPKGAVIQFYQDKFISPSGLAQYLLDSRGTAKIKDNKLIVLRDWINDDKKVKGAYIIARELAVMAKNQKTN